MRDRKARQLQRRVMLSRRFVRHCFATLPDRRHGRDSIPSPRWQNKKRDSPSSSFATALRCRCVIVLRFDWTRITPVSALRKMALVRLTDRVWILLPGGFAAHLPAPFCSFGGWIGQSGRIGRRPFTPFVGRCAFGVGRDSTSTERIRLGCLSTDARRATDNARRTGCSANPSGVKYAYSIPDSTPGPG